LPSFELLISLLAGCSALWGTNIPLSHRNFGGAVVSRKQWVRVRVQAGQKPPTPEKEVITAACERFIAEVLRPRFLHEIQPTSFNYPVAITGKWHGTKYRFLQRFRSDSPDAIEPEFEAPLRAWSMSAATVLMCPGIAIRASGFASTALCLSPTPCG
jgi:hypothetical protein